jgi:hypothetical protein
VCGLGQCSTDPICVMEMYDLKMYVLLDELVEASETCAS